uniref:Uncharacterized mitochondrial protein AtMg00810-like n=1 Tax=Nicotiana tabacum TaxID=4097 RepID=A0A1S4CR40_TOBAC|nr:PREDICTED: uncharacterized mitochondrial protein AtMg00810-like [Nicotiana tabacum]
MEILREARDIIICTLDLLKEFDVSVFPCVSSPLESSSKLYADEGPLIQDPTIYRHRVGKLNYLIHTRPDLSFVVLKLIQYIQSPRLSHFSAALRVLRYLRSDPCQGIILNTNPTLDLLAFCDADWASCLETRRFVSDFYITLGGSLIYWNRRNKPLYLCLPLRRNIAHAWRSY